MSSNHSHGSGNAATSDSHGAHGHGHHDVAAEVKRYKIIASALALGTLLTVWASTIDFGSHTMNIVVALIIASVKGFLVMGYFMHLMSERKLIYAVLIATVFFVSGLMYLTLWASNPLSIIHTTAK